MKRLFSIFLIIVICFGLVGCAPVEPDNSGDGDNSDEVAFIEDADLVAFSHNRIENADLSFNMQMTATSLEPVNSFYSSEEEVSFSFFANDTEYVYTGKSSDFEYKKTDFFSAQETGLQNARDNARRIADFIVEKVTVLNKVVNDNGISYYLEYNEEKDLLTAYCISYNQEGGIIDAENFTSFAKIEFYNDEDGDEVVHYVTFDYNSGENSIHISQIIYSKNKSYEINTTTYQTKPNSKEKVENSGFSHVIKAKKVNDKWQGLSWYFRENNAFFTKEGVYDLANNQIWIEFLFEGDGGFFSLIGSMFAYRDGELLFSQEPAYKTDDVKLVLGSASTAGFFKSNRNESIDLSFSIFEGWEEIYIDLTEEEWSWGGDYPQLALGENDYILLSNGIKLTSDCLWVEEFGVIKVDYLNGEYLTLKDNVVHDQEWFDNIKEEEKIYFSIGAYCKREGKVVEGITFTLNYSRRVSEDKVVVVENVSEKVSKMIKDFGLYIKGEDVIANIATISEMEANSQYYMNPIFEGFFGVGYTYEKVVETSQKIGEDLVNISEETKNLIKNKEIVKLEDLPEKPADFKLASINESELGKCTVNEDGIDFSNIEIQVEKSNILSEDKEYTVIAKFSSLKEGVLENAFSTSVYKKEKMAFTGGNVSLPLTLGVGSYRLEIYFGRQTDNGIIKLSETIAIKTDLFEKIVKIVEVEAGTYYYTFYEENGCVFLDVDFVEKVEEDVPTDDENITGGGTIVGGGEEIKPN